MASGPNSIVWLPDTAEPSRNSTVSTGTPQCSATKAAMRPLISAAAIFAAMPLRSVPEDAAVGEAFGTFAVLVAVMRTKCSGTPNSSATIWATLVNSPCPISVPP